MELLFRQILFDVLILNGRLSVVDQRDALGNDVNRHDLIVLRQQHCQRKTHIAGSGNGKFHSAHLMSCKIFGTTAQTFADPHAGACVA